jgi:hypothetical protein
MTSRARFYLGILVAGMVVGVVANPAAAYDATGSYTGKYSCKGDLEGVPNNKDNYVSEGSVEITQSGNSVGVLLFGAYLYNGFQILKADPTKSNKGELGLAFCGTDDLIGPSSTDFDELGRFKVSTKPDSGKGKLTGVSTYTTFGGSVGIYTCKWSFKRTSTVDPAVPVSCP